jgi:hypothetical protein
MHSQTIRRCLMIVPFGALLAVLGCGGAKYSPTLFTVSGNVTFHGKPVPTGFVSFEPNAAQGNSGPGCGATIKNGYYETDTNKGITGGPYLVTVNGADGIPTTIDGEDAPQGASLFPPYNTKVDFPMEDTTWDIEVPVTAAAN